MAGCGNSVFGAHALVDFHHADGAFYLECACADMESGCAQLFDDLFCDLARFASRCVGEQNNEFVRSEEKTSELQSLMRISYAVFCLKKKNQTNNKKYTYIHTLR